MNQEASSSSASSWRSQGLHATVHRACPKCSAPGVYQATDYILSGWPGCWVPPDDERANTPVGATCPNCGASRNPGLVSRLGEIWRKHFG